MFGWWRAWRRRQLTKRPFPRGWHFILSEYAPFVESLSPAETQRLQKTIQVMVAEKNWEGCGGLKLSDLHRVIISAHAARLTLHWEFDPFDEVQSILVYPDTYVANGPSMLGSTLVVEDSVRLGEAWYRGPVVLAWRDVLRSTMQQNPGHNVVIHEFAHHIDMRNGQHADGIPPIEDPQFAEAWLQMLDEDFSRLVELCHFGLHAGLDCYAATNPAEFFAVLSEAYFEAPQELAAAWPRPYSLLRRFYEPTHP